MKDILNRNDTLAVSSNGRNNNLNIIRFVAALMVIFGHSYAATYSYSLGDPLHRLTLNQLDFGGLAVSIFFTFGGFLICKSMERLQTAKKFFSARIMRIFPPLIFVTFIMTFLLGPIVTYLPLTKYFSDSRTYMYLLNSIMILVHNLPGVFCNNINTSVNGPLWTLPVEFLCYIMCYLAYKMHILSRKIARYTIIQVLVIYFILYHLMSEMLVFREALRPIMLFYFGMLYYIYRDKIELKYRYLLSCILILCISVTFNIMWFMIVICLPYILLCIGYGTKRKLQHFGEKMEISYGIYLFGWPVQQCIVLIFGKNMLPILNFIISAPIAVICGIITFYMIERPVSICRKKSRNK